LESTLITCLISKIQCTYYIQDLANIVSYQQDQVDEVEAHMEKANKNAESGLKQIEKARVKQDQACIIS
jgi:hypothetical protein